MIDVDPATQALAERALQFGAAQLGIRRLHPKLVWHEPWADGRWGEFPRERPDTVLISTNVPVEHLPGVIFHELGHLQEYAKGYVICEASAESVERRLVAEWRDHEAAAARAEQEA